MLKEIIEAARLTPEFCAGLARVPIEQFKEWLDGKQPVPSFVVQELTAVLGVTETDLRSRKPSREIAGGNAAPAIWFKLRDSRLTTPDREVVGLVRRLGFSMTQLDQLGNEHGASKWRALAKTINDQIDRSAPPSRQGLDAAAVFRSLANLDQGKTGIGEVFRPKLRQAGLVVIESPIPKSSLEGCCFQIGVDAEVRPCVFGNTYKSTWFRRNEVLMHEVCHAIFDLENDPVSLDFRNSGWEAEGLVSEARAQAFAKEVLAPRTVLVHYANQFGIKWGELSVGQLAQLVASIHVEQSTILRAAFEGGLISQEDRDRYLSYECGDLLKQISPRALYAFEFLKHAAGKPKWIVQNRQTTVGTRRLRLPVGYVSRVLESANSGDISFGKAAEMLMMDRYAFMERFEDVLKEPALV